MRNYACWLLALMVACAVGQLIREILAYIGGGRRIPVRVKHMAFAVYVALLAVPVLYDADILRTLIG